MKKNKRVFTLFLALVLLTLTATASYGAVTPKETENAGIYAIGSVKGVTVTPQSEEGDIAPEAVLVSGISTEGYYADVLKMNVQYVNARDTSDYLLILVEGSVLPEEQTSASILFVDQVKGSALLNNGCSVFPEFPDSDRDMTLFIISIDPTICLQIPMKYHVPAGKTAIQESDFNWTKVKDTVFTGSAITPAVTSSKLASTEFEISYGSNINVGTATVTVTGKGLHSGTVTKNFAITKADDASYRVSAVQELLSESSAGSKNKTYTYDLDTLVTGITREKAGTVSYSVKSAGTYTGTVTIRNTTLQFTVASPQAKNVTDRVTVTVSSDNYKSQDVTISFKFIDKDVKEPEPGPAPADDPTPTPGPSSGPTSDPSVKPSDEPATEPAEESSETGENPFKDVKETDYYYGPILWALEQKITAGSEPDLFEPEAVCTRGQMVTFLWRAARCPEPASSVNPFKDVSSAEYYFDAILWALEQKVTAGSEPELFEPEAVCTRGQMITFLWRTAGCPKPASSANPFKDVSNAEYYYDAVLWAVEQKITAGSEVDLFEPEAVCTRGQAVTFLYRFLEK